MTTKTEFAAFYRAELLASQPWAQDEAKLNRFMGEVEKTLNGGNSVGRTGPSWDATCRFFGMPAKTTLKNLWAMPN